MARPKGKPYPSGVTLLWGLVACGQIRLRRINGYQDLPQLLSQQEAA